MTGIRRIHVISKTHLDLGFTRLASEVVEDYLGAFIPRAISINDRLRTLGRPERMVWTLGSWVVAEFLDRASAAGRRQLESAIAQGDIAWHALPFTMQSEMADAALMRGALRISQRLDAAFGKKTIAAKLTDVPGHTRALVPLLAEAGVEFLHIGVNGGINMPQVPPMFLWRDENTQTQVTVLQHADYGGFYAPPGGSEAIAIEMTYDNEGPPSLQSVVNHLVRLGERHPDADVNGSTLDAFAQSVRGLADSLPVVTDEIGDTWIYGVASRPRLVAAYRGLARWYTDTAPQFDDKLFISRILRIPEHTWGLDTIMHMPHELALEEPAFTQELEAGRFSVFESSWQEQDAYLVEALAAVPPELAAQAANAAAGEPWNVQPLHRDPLVHLTIDPLDGTLLAIDHSTAPRFAAVGRIRYQSYGRRAYEDYRAHYVRPEWQGEWWVRHAFGRPGLEGSPWAARHWTPRVSAVSPVESARGEGVKVEVEFDVDIARIDHAIPRGVTITYLYDRHLSVLSVEIAWEQKAPTRLPEAMWLSVEPADADGRWALKKLGSEVDAHHTVLGGARRTHAVETAIVRGSGGSTVIHNLDTPLITLGDTQLLDDQAFPVDEGAAAGFTLFDNLWCTNYPLWIEGPGRLRFVIASEK